MAIHPTAIVEDGAKLGSEIEIGPFCVVGREVVLGDGVRLLSHVFIGEQTNIGARTVVHARSALGGKGQIRGPGFADSKLLIGSHCVIHEGVTMNGGSRAGGGVTRVGSNCYFMANSHVAHDCVVGDDVTFGNFAIVAGHAHLGQGVVLGDLSAVQQYCRIGKGAMIGGLTGVNTDVIPYGMARGERAVLSGINTVDLKRRGLNRLAVDEMRAAFKAIFLGNTGTLQERARQVKEGSPNFEQIQEITDFILVKARHGLCVADPLTVTDGADRYGHL